VSEGRKPRILVVDDEAPIRSVITRALAATHEVVAVGSSAEALALLEAGERFSAMLCDLMMPNMPGMELCEIVKQRWPELAAHTALLTGGAFSERASRFLESSGLPALEKPFSLKGLQELVSTLTADR
jgi:CheY-like chemotaxis protein